MKKTDRHSAMWPKRPRIYEINTSVWLHDLTVRYGTPLTLATIPGHEWDRISGLHIDAVWFMGLWARSAMGRAIAGRDGSLSDEFRRVLPDFQEGDNVGSPYCVRSYEVDNCFGGPEGLAVARERLAERGVRLVADFVPNHVAPDHRWVADHPEYFIRGDEDDLAADPRSFLAAGSQVFACGKDPYFPSWPDVLQLNAFHPGLREAAIATVVDLAARCDGVRCDMAMLFIADIFARTWGDRAGPAPEEEYWRAVIKAVKEVNPSFLFIAEAYWDREWELQTQGFDYCYDKKLYDRLVHGSAEDVRLHLCARREYQDRLLRFIENHDEPRAAAVFSPMKGRSAALIVATVPGLFSTMKASLKGGRKGCPFFSGAAPGRTKMRN